MYVLKTSTQDLICIFYDFTQVIKKLLLTFFSKIHLFPTYIFHLVCSREIENNLFLKKQISVTWSNDNQNIAKTYKTIFLILVRLYLIQQKLERYINKQHLKMNFQYLTWISLRQFSIQQMKLTSIHTHSYNVLYIQYITYYFVIIFIQYRRKIPTISMLAYITFHQNR